MVGGSVSSAEGARWGFQNRTDLVTLTSGERVVVQRYRRRADAAYRVRVMQGLHEPSARAGIAIPRVRAADLEADPPWVAFEALPGEPVAALGLDDPRFPQLARVMGEMLAAFRTLPTAGLELDERWPTRRASQNTPRSGQRRSPRRAPSPTRSPRCSRVVAPCSRTATSHPSTC